MGSTSSNSEIPFFVSSTWTYSLTNCKASRSPVTIRTSCSAEAWAAKVPMISSPSNPSNSSTVIPSASRTSRAAGNCSDNSDGVGFRCALYSLYSLLRNVYFPLSKATTTPEGFRSATSLMIMFVNPNTALVK